MKFRSDSIKHSPESIWIVRLHQHQLRLLGVLLIIDKKPPNFFKNPMAVQPNMEDLLEKTYRKLRHHMTRRFVVHSPATQTCLTQNLNYSPRAILDIGPQSFGCSNPEVPPMYSVMSFPILETTSFSVLINPTGKLTG